MESVILDHHGNNDGENSEASPPLAQISMSLDHIQRFVPASQVTESSRVQPDPPLTASLNAVNPTEYESSAPRQDGAPPEERFFSSDDSRLGNEDRVIEEIGGVYSGEMVRVSQCFLCKVTSPLTDQF